MKKKNKTLTEISFVSTFLLIFLTFILRKLYSINGYLDLAIFSVISFLIIVLFFMLVVFFDRNDKARIKFEEVIIPFILLFIIIGSILFGCLYIKGGFF